MRAKTTEDRKLIEVFDPLAEELGLDIVRVRLMDRIVRVVPVACRSWPSASATATSMSTNAPACRAKWRPSLTKPIPITGEYTLEVSSPGIDRPLTRLKDFETYEGYEARLELDRLAEGRKRFRGILAGIEDDHVAIDLEGEAETAMIPFAWVIDAKLVLTDELLKKGAEARASRPPEEDDGEDFENGRRLRRR